MNARLGRRIRRNLLAPRIAIALLVLLAVVAAALLAPLFPVSPTDQDLYATLKPPGFRSPNGILHLLGTDQLGRDLFSRMLMGARISLTIGAAALAIAMTVGVSMGLLAGYLGGLVDTVVTGVTETLMALPFVLLAIAVVAALGASLPVLVLTLGLTGWVSFAKLVRSRVFELREEEFVQAAEALGARSPRVMLKHVLPSVAPLLLVEGTLQLGTLILAEAGLSFLGLGVPPPLPSWGGILSEGQVFVQVAWWIPTLPGLLLLLTILSVNLIGDALRDALAPEG